MSFWLQTISRFNDLVIGLDIIDYLPLVLVPLPYVLMIMLMVLITLIIIIYCTLPAVSPTTKCPGVTVIASLYKRRCCVTTHIWANSL